MHLDAELRDVKLAALRAQATQTAPVIAAMGEATYMRWWRVADFVELTPA